MQEQDIKLGTVGDMAIKFEGGIASVSLNAAVPGDAGVTAGVQIKIESAKLIKLIFDAIQAKSPEGVRVIEEAVEQIVIKAVAAI